MSVSKKTQTKNKSVKDIINMMEEWFSKLPSLPKNSKEAIVNITPWIAIIFGILGVFSGLTGLGALGVGSSLMMMGGYYHPGGYFIGGIVSLVSSILLLISFPGVKANKMQGWNLLFYSQAVGAISSLLTVSLMGLIFSGIGFYLLFQIKSYYK